MSHFNVMLIEKRKYRVPNRAPNRTIRSSPLGRNKGRLHLSRGETFAESNKAVRK